MVGGTIAAILVTVLTILGSVMTIGTYKQQLTDVRDTVSDYKVRTGRDDARWEEILRRLDRIDKHLELDKKP